MNKKKITAWAVMKNKELLTDQRSIYFDKQLGKEMAKSVANQLNENICNKNDKFTIKKVTVIY